MRERPRRPGLVPILALTGLLVTLTWPAATAAPSRVVGSPAAQRQQGRDLYLVGCLSCHGEAGRGVSTPTGDLRGPPLVNAGEAGAYYQLSTGRMPLANSEHQARRKPRAYDDDEIDALVAYVASLGDGPELPSIDLGKAELADGGELFRAHCAACHSASGSGGALSYGRSAPALSETTPLEVAAAIRAGPGQMPQFGPASFDAGEVADIARYVQYLREPADRGGLPIGRLGPVPEGFVAWFFGMGALIGALVWIGRRAPARRPGGDGGHG